MQMYPPSSRAWFRFFFFWVLLVTFCAKSLPFLKTHLFSKMSNEICGDCQGTIFAAELPTRVPGNQFHGKCFKCMFVFYGVFVFFIGGLLTCLSQFLTLTQVHSNDANIYADIIIMHFIC